LSTKLTLGETIRIRGLDGIVCVWRIGRAWGIIGMTKKRNNEIGYLARGFPYWVRKTGQRMKDW
jgi:hypothetical protein